MLLNSIIANIENMDSVTIRRCIFIFCCMLGVCWSETSNETKKYLEKTLDALQLALQFFDREYTSLNLDAVISTRVTEGQLKVLEQKLQIAPQRWNIDSTIIDKISKIRRLSNGIAEKAIPYQISTNLEYYQTFSPLMRKGFWEVDNKDRKIPASVYVWPYRDEELLDGPTSNGCIGEILGTLGKTACDISSQCWQVMTEPGYHGYSLSHQLLYVMIGQMNGCWSQMEMMRVRHEQPEINQLQTNLCANMLAEIHIIANSSFPWYKRDLFLEDAAFCGILGFHQFFRFGWLENILGWQNVISGCFDLNSVFGRKLHAMKTRQFPRKKRSERLLKDGCLSHLTAMAITSLTQYIRYLVEALRL